MIWAREDVQREANVAGARYSQAVRYRYDFPDRWTDERIEELRQDMMFWKAAVGVAKEMHKYGWEPTREQAKKMIEVMGLTPKGERVAA